MSNRNLGKGERHHLRHLREVHRDQQDNLCFYCDVVMTDPEDGLERNTDATLEHKKPKSQGGGSNYINTCAACRECNIKRGNRPVKDGRVIPSIVIRSAK